MKSQDNPPVPPPPPIKAVKPTDTVPETKTVQITPTGFSPPRVEIKAGETVRWDNTDHVNRHNIKFTTDPGGNDPIGERIAASKSYQRKFDVPGTYDYFCESTGMAGAVVVSA